VRWGAPPDQKREDLDSGRPWRKGCGKKRQKGHRARELAVEGREWKGLAL
jgi:hypothetical protein